MSDEVSVEATGETVGEAKWKALRDLERVAPRLDKASIRFQVVSEGERGLLGVGYTPARVVATGIEDDRPARGDETAAETRARELVERMMSAIAAGVTADAREGEEEIAVTCDGGDLGLLIGKHGQTIDAVQYLCNAILFRSGGDKPVTIDVAGYRERRRATLESMTVQAAERAAAGERVVLDPMAAGERRFVHERLKDVAGVQTSSEGAEPNRRVVVGPA